MLNRKIIALCALLPLTLAIAATTPMTSSSAMTAAKPATKSEVLAPTDVQAATARMVYGLLSDSRYAYRPMALDDSLSADIFRRYLDSLDGQKLFFTQADITRFQPYKTTLDDSIKSQNLSAPYDIFRTYAQRVDQRVAYARSLLAKPFDYTTKETFLYDREKAAWAPDQAALNDIWRKYVKNDSLRLKLAGRSPEEIRKTLDKRYASLGSRVHEISGENVFENFMDAYATSIDPHTSYMSPRTAENFNMQMRLSLEGIGAVLQRQEEFVVIRTLVPGGPALGSGKLKVGDRITAVGQGDKGPMVDVVGWPIDDVVDQIRGKKGTRLRLDVLPAEAGVDGQHQTVTLVRDTVKLEEQAASKSIINAGNKRIGVVTLPGFYIDFEAARRGDKNYRSATADVARLLGELKAAKVDGVVMDLRDNGGGSLIEAVELTGLFIDKGPVVQVKDSSGRVEVDSDEIPGITWGGPLAVLVNRSSASASEIFAAAIQDYGRGLIIGEPTFGKGTVQNLFDLDRFTGKKAPMFGQVKLTMAQFFRIDGDTTQHAGVIPEIQFPVTVDATEFGESTYDNALPASRIQRASFANLGNFAPIIPRLSTQHDARVLTDREYQWWASDVAKFRAERSKKVISLNEADRRLERDRDTAQRKQRELDRKALGLTALDGDDKDDGLQADERNVNQQVAREAAAKKRPDPLLRETSAILSDAINLLNGDPKLVTQVLPVTRQPTVWSD